MRRYADHAGLPVHIMAHTFRRSSATELIRSGANLYHVKELLGHESLDTLRHYTRLTITDLREMRPPRWKCSGMTGLKMHVSTSVFSSKSFDITDLLPSS